MKIALVGATNNKEKFGNKILNNLISKGYEVFPINPKEDFIENIKCYKSLSEIKEKIDIVNIVTPPKITFEILKECLNLGLKRVWCQPGSSDEMAKKFLYENNFDYIVDSCIMF